MTVFVTVQASGGMTRLRRYETDEPHHHLCTHEGLYDPESVSPFGVGAYLDNGASQDRVRHELPHKAAARRPA